MYEKYKGRVNFIVVDLDLKRAPEQQALVRKFYRGSIPHLVVLGKKGDVLYNDSGENSESNISAILDKALQ